MSTFYSGQLDYISKLNDLVSGALALAKITVDDANFTFDVVSSNPRITFDSGDWLEYDRASNYLRLVVGSTEKLRVDSNGQIIMYGIDANYIIGKNGSNPRITGDSGDWIEFDRTNNKFKYAFASADTISIGTLGIEFLGTGGTTPKKYLRATAGNFEMVNDAYGAVIVQITDGGRILAAGAGNNLGSIAAVTNGAGAGAGTLTNAPAAGNPTKWMSFVDGGTTRYIPMW